MYDLEMELTRLQHTQPLENAFDKSAHLPDSIVDEELWILTARKEYGTILRHSSHLAENEEAIFEPENNSSSNNNSNNNVNSHLIRLCQHNNNVSGDNKELSLNVSVNNTWNDTSTFFTPLSSMVVNSNRVRKIVKRRPQQLNIHKHAHLCSSPSQQQQCHNNKSNDTLNDNSNNTNTNINTNNVDEPTNNEDKNKSNNKIYAGKENITVTATDSVADNNNWLNIASLSSLPSLEIYHKEEDDCEQEIRTNEQIHTSNQALSNVTLNKVQSFNNNNVNDMVNIIAKERNTCSHTSEIFSNKDNQSAVQVNAKSLVEDVERLSARHTPFTLYAVQSLKSTEESMLHSEEAKLQSASVELTCQREEHNVHEEEEYHNEHVSLLESSSNNGNTYSTYESLVVDESDNNGKTITTTIIDVKKDNVIINNNSENCKLSKEHLYHQEKPTFIIKPVHEVCNSSVLYDKGMTNSNHKQFKCTTNNELHTESEIHSNTKLDLIESCTENNITHKNIRWEEEEHRDKRLINHYDPHKTVHINDYNNNNSNKNNYIIPIDRTNNSDNNKYSMKIMSIVNSEGEEELENFNCLLKRKRKPIIPRLPLAHVIARREERKRMMANKANKLIKPSYTCAKIQTNKVHHCKNNEINNKNNNNNNKSIDLNPFEYASLPYPSPLVVTNPNVNELRTQVTSVVDNLSDDGLWCKSTSSSYSSAHSRADASNYNDNNKDELEKIYIVPHVTYNIKTEENEEATVEDKAASNEIDSIQMHHKSCKQETSEKEREQESNNKMDSQKMQSLNELECLININKKNNIYNATVNYACNTIQEVHNITKASLANSRTPSIADETYYSANNMTIISISSSSEDEDECVRGAYKGNTVNTINTLATTNTLSVNVTPALANNDGKVLHIPQINTSMCKSEYIQNTVSLEHANNCDNINRFKDYEELFREKEKLSDELEQQQKQQPLLHESGDIVPLMQHENTTKMTKKSTHCCTMM